MKSIKLQILTILFLNITLNSFSFNNHCHVNGENHLNSFQSSEPIIKSVRIFRDDSELFDPVIELGTNESITLKFDDLAETSTNYSYSIIHCSKDWTESEIDFTEFMEGFEVNQITDFANSMGTIVPYTHYNISIPNNNVKPKISGNYLIRVFDTYNPDKIIIEEKFMVIEKLITVNATIKQPIDGSLRLTSQQIDLRVVTNTLKISDPYNELIPIIFQNNQPDNSLSDLKPVFIRSNEIVYSAHDKLIFDGVNEYRFFDINSIRYLSSGISNIDKREGLFNVQLSPSENNRTSKYTVIPDINGKSKIKLEQSEQSDIEADYVWVYFTLPYYDQLPGKEIFVYGGISDWQFKPENMMIYSFQRQAYELRLFLKQGFYNYRYVVRDSKTGETDHTFFEGNHYATENSYQILIYYRQIGQRYDRLVGYKSINSRNPI
ncbi:MAG: DUF5103 domain-containing protein [Tenuifilaceae bacterium]